MPGQQRDPEIPQADSAAEAQEATRSGAFGIRAQFAVLRTGVPDRSANPGTPHPDGP